ncbi:hypothetical protein IscW_ISCW017398 [Ixodes scapularis]|uniref:Uncharacterized protein n=1 Tax=Ixodes scapularis TaxID=6945 RepID=B7P888_IXOSC|nr:hypothetical protein IscW_ISCW017398 [Ixodes scapularis]|eukprot:XP_002401597.1 hypothetical protein IscW_ISCW017398 [Ixodes scapularis]
MHGNLAATVPRVVKHGGTRATPIPITIGSPLDEPAAPELREPEASHSRHLLGAA